MDWMILVVADAILLILATVGIAIAGVVSFRRVRRKVRHVPTTSTSESSSPSSKG